MNSEKEKTIDTIRSFLNAEFEGSGYFLTDTVFTIRDGVYHILLELVGPKLYSRNELDLLRKKLSEYTRKPVEIYVRSRPEVVLTKYGYTTFNELQDRFLKQAESLYKKELINLIEGTL